MGVSISHNFPVPCGVVRRPRLDYIDVTGLHRPATQGSWGNQETNMLDYLIGTANVVCLAGCVYIAYVLIVNARTAGLGIWQSRGNASPDAETGERRATDRPLDAYYMM